MPGLTPEQIRTGDKGYARSVPPPPDKTGRYLCHLCQWPRWVSGTYRDAIDHYRTTHQGKDGHDS